MAAATTEQGKKSWFEDNPRKTLILIFLTFLVAATLVTEKVLAHISHQKHMVLFTERRYINLREYPPNLDVVDVPSDKTLREADGLQKKA